MNRSLEIGETDLRIGFRESVVIWDPDECAFIDKLLTFGATVVQGAGATVVQGCRRGAGAC